MLVKGATVHTYYRIADNLIFHEYDIHIIRQIDSNITRDITKSALDNISCFTTCHILTGPEIGKYVV